MEPREFNSFCGALIAATYVNQWRGSHVWKVGGKVFAIGRWNKNRHSGITFKVSPIAYEVLKNTQGFRPAPYFASIIYKRIVSISVFRFDKENAKCVAVHSCVR